MANGVALGNMMALTTAVFALYGRIVATAPLTMSDQSETDVEEASADVRKSKVRLMLTVALSVSLVGGCAPTSSRISTRPPRGAAPDAQSIAAHCAAADELRR